jgi:hypothetical protein
MQIQSASALLKPTTQKTLSTALAAGKTVTIPIAKPDELGKLQSYLISPDIKELHAQYTSNLATVPVLALHSSAQQALKADGLTFSPEKLALGAGSGAVVGAGVGLLIEGLRTVAPRSAVALTLGCTIMGTGIGAAFGAGLCEISYDPTNKKLWLKPSTAKA